MGGKKQKNYTQSEGSISVWQNHAPEFFLGRVSILCNTDFLQSLKVVQLTTY